MYFLRVPSRQLHASSENIFSMKLTLGKFFQQTLKEFFWHSQKFTMWASPSLPERSRSLVTVIAKDRLVSECRGLVDFLWIIYGNVRCERICFLLWHPTAQQVYMKNRQHTEQGERRVLKQGWRTISVAKIAITFTEVTRGYTLHYF